MDDMLLSEEQSKEKQKLWESLNADWEKKQKEKIGNNVGTKRPKRKRLAITTSSSSKRQRADTNTENEEAETETRVSEKVNYNVLNTLFGGSDDDDDEEEDEEEEDN